MKWQRKSIKWNKINPRWAGKNNDKVSILLCLSLLSSSMNIERNAACWRRYGLIWYKPEIETVEEIFLRWPWQLSFELQMCSPWHRLENCWHCCPERFACYLKEQLLKGTTAHFLVLKCTPFWNLEKEKCCFASLQCCSGPGSCLEMICWIIYRKPECSTLDPLHL